MTYLAEVPRAPVLAGVRQPASPEEHAVQTDSKWLSPCPGQHPSRVLEVQLVSARDPARVARPGWIHLRYDTVEEIDRTNLEAKSQEVEHFIAIFLAKQMLDIL